MPGSNEACSNCFFVVTERVKTMTGLNVIYKNKLFCHVESPSGGPVTVALWPPVEPTDWCGRWSDTGRAVYGTFPAPIPRDYAAAVTFQGEAGAVLSAAAGQNAAAEFDIVGSLFARSATDQPASVEFDATGALRADGSVP